MQTAQRDLKYYKKSAAPAKRVVKMEGNVAYINNGFAKKKVRQPNEMAAPKNKTVNAAKPVKKTAKKQKGALVATLAVFFIAFCALAVLVSRYAAVCSIGSGNNKLEQSIEETYAQIEILQVDMELRDDIEYIRNTARDELNMTYPTQDQKVYIELGS